MSAANSAARKRAQELASQQPARVQPPAGLTLTQVIGVIDKRLTILESSSTITGITQVSNDNTEEFETRFEILAEEISNLKQIVLSLQSYTMDVNKMLMEERKKLSSYDAEIDLSQEIIKV